MSDTPPAEPTPEPVDEPTDEPTDEPEPQPTEAPPGAALPGPHVSEAADANHLGGSNPGPPEGLGDDVPREGPEPAPASSDTLPGPHPHDAADAHSLGGSNVFPAPVS